MLRIALIPMLRHHFTSAFRYRHRSTIQHSSLFVATLLLLLLQALPLFARSNDELLVEQSHDRISAYMLKEYGTPSMLMGKNISTPLPPASLTKVLTSIMAIESGRLLQDVVITRESTLVEPSKAGFTVGERIKLIDLVKAAMVSSSNDAAFAIGIYLSGSVDAFVDAMNYKARQIGMRNSHFTNPAGYDRGQYAGNVSTAEDLMRLTEYAVRNSTFNQIARMDRAVFVEQSTRKVYNLRTHNKLLAHYPHSVGIKTGWTTRAGGCLIARAVKGDKDLLVVMLNAKISRWDTAASMFDLAFNDRLPTSQFVASNGGQNLEQSERVIKGEQAALLAAAATPALLHAGGKALQAKQSGVVSKLSKEKKLSRKDRLALKKQKGKLSKKERLALKKKQKLSKKEKLALSKKEKKLSRKERLALKKQKGKLSKKERLALKKKQKFSKKEKVAQTKQMRKAKRNELLANKVDKKKSKKEF
uniref:D-alanyl-D-alanine carboxypeptidase n=1 Tax=Chlorobium chlorochromatii (strain CaD3) TaxID=340177 RepID=Q3ARN2_CHLCH